MSRQKKSTAIDLEDRLSRFLEAIGSCSCKDASSHRSELVKAKLPGKMIEPVIKALKAIAEPKRLQILYLLKDGTPKCLCELEAVLDISQPTITHHIKVLEKAGVIETRKSGKWLLCMVKDSIFVDTVEKINQYYQETGKTS
ncbi:MAG: ArsR/SmtB family transcription factor [Candidatus Hodarchaeales archaeon]